MSRAYEGIIVFDSKGREEGMEQLMAGVQTVLEEKGAQIESAESLGRKEFAYAPDKISGGLMARYEFSLEPSALDEVREVLTLREEVHYQSYERR